MSNYTILSVGGSIVIPKTGFNITFLKKFRKLIINEVRRGRRFVLIVGGGTTCRKYQAALGKVIKADDSTLDWIGIYSTVLNAQFVRLMFGKYAHQTSLMGDPNKRQRTNKPIIIGSGWKPGCSSDKDAVLAAKAYGAKEVINISDVAYVYDKDPDKYKNAKPFVNLTWKEYGRMFSGWTPGKSAPFGPPAAKEAKRLGITVKILRAGRLEELQKAIRGKKFRGTTINSVVS